jgi:predicted RecA/RadA family phage recombinase
MDNYVQPGKTLTLIAPSGGVTAGLGYLIGSIFVVAAVTAAEAETFAGDTEGVFTLAKVGSQAWSPGDRVYWDGGNSRCTKTAASGLQFIGFATESVGSGAGLTTGNVYVTQTDVPAVQAAVASLGTTTALTALAVTASVLTDLSTAGGNTYSDAAVNAIFAEVETKLNLKADNADAETLRTEVEARLDAAEGKVDAILAALRTAGVIAP